MFKIDDKTLELFNSNYKQIVSIVFNGVEESFELTEANILQGGLSLNRYCISSSKLEIGSAIASELTLNLDNRNEQFNDVTFEGAELFVKIGIKKWDADEWEKATIQWIPLGYFTVDETPRKLSNITITALDRMVQFDKEVDYDAFTAPLTYQRILEICCEECQVPLGQDNLLLKNVLVSSIPVELDTQLTYRQLIQWLAEVNGVCAYIDWDGKLRMHWYVDTDIRITKSQRYTSDIQENDITITGVQIKDNDGNTFVGGEKGYVLNIEGNKLIPNNYHLTFAKLLGERLQGFTYRPYSCTCKSAPYLYPLDRITFVDKKGIEHYTIITHITYTINTSTELEGKGETLTSNSFAKINPLTKEETIIIEKMKKDIENDISNREQAVLQMNEIMSNSLGLYRSIITESDGSNSYYYHNEETLEDSSVIYSFKSGGFAWTDDWNSGNPVWQYGFTRDGNAVFNALSTYKISSEYLEVESITKDKLSKEVTDSITKEITDITTELEQTFNVSLGQLDSKITLETTNREQEINSLNGEITTINSSITTLSSEINQTAESIRLEVLAREQEISEVNREIESSNTEIDNVKASLELYVAKDENDQIVSMLNASASEINITANRLAISSTYFKLTKTGKITATGGKIGGFTLTSSSFYNGISSFSTTGTDGIYLGTDGLNIGGNFTVSKDGTVSLLKGDISIGQVKDSYPMYTKVDVTGFLQTWGDSNSSYESYVKINYSDMTFYNRSDLYSNNEVKLVIGLQGDIYGYGAQDYPRIGACQSLHIGVYDTYDPSYDNYNYFTYVSLDANGKSQIDIFAQTKMTIYSKNGQLQGTWVNNSGSAITSDRNLKHDIESLDDKYSSMFDKLVPIRYKYNDGTSNRYHVGFIAQDVEQSILNSGLTTNDFAGYIQINDIDKDNKEVPFLALRYSEFIALCVNEIQKLKNRVNELEKGG